MLDSARRRDNTEHDDLDSSLSRFLSDYCSAVIRETDQKQTRSSTPGQAKRMTNVIRKVIAIAILAINGKGGVIDGAGPLRRRDRATLTRRSSSAIARTAASQTQNNPTR